MTLFEVLLVLAVITFVVVMILPARSRPRGSPWISCLMNVKQIDLGFIMYAMDNNGKFAIQTSVTNGGTMEFLERNQTFPHYQKLSQFVGNTRVLVCPADKSRQTADSFQSLSDTNLSYFLNADFATNNPTTSIMAGERNLQADGQSVQHGTFAFLTKMALDWTPEIHRTAGVLGFADGHVQMCRATDLNSLMRQQGLTTVRLSVP
jgi:hypothetical protein